MMKIPFFFFSTHLLSCQEYQENKNP